MNITLQALQAFKAAADTGSFTRAAEQIYMTQPAFSRLISALEKEWDVRLFERTTRSVSLTPEGEICLRRVEQMLGSYALLQSDLERARRALSGELRVGFNPVSGPPEFFVRSMKQLTDEYPNISVVTTRAYSCELVEYLKSGALDCALVSAYYITPTDPLCTTPLQLINLYALLPCTHPLAAQPVLTAQQLCGVPLTFMKSSAPLTRQYVVDAFVQAELPITEDAPAYDLEDMILRVRIGNGVGITSFNDPNHQYNDITAVLLHLPNDQDGYRVLAWHKSCRNPALPIFARMLEAAKP